MGLTQSAVLNPAKQKTTEWKDNAMANFNDFIDALEDGLETFAREESEEYKDAAKTKGKAFIEETKNDLERWTKALAKGDLSRNDFEWLVKSKKDLFELNTLKQIGLTKVAVDRFVNGVIDLVVDTAFETFL